MLASGAIGTILSPGRAFGKSPRRAEAYPLAHGGGRGGTGRRAALRALWPKGRGSSSLLDRTIRPGGAQPPREGFALAATAAPPWSAGNGSRRAAPCSRSGCHHHAVPAAVL